jgi:hypothetical protein
MPRARAESRQSVLERIAELALQANETGDPAADNQRAAAFLAEEEKGGASWEKESPWHRPTAKDRLLLDEACLLGWHFRETGNPVFAALALRLPLSPEFSAAADWARGEVERWVENLAALADQPPKGSASRAMAGALGLAPSANANPFREARNALRDDWLYCAVERLRLGGVPATGALRRVAADIALSYEAVRGVYYERKALVRKAEPNAAKLAAVRALPAKK